ncbi:putative aldo-keto reductase [Aulographum hederae CBS 113979]|uniref:Putative aldo-keto reductase n=1 Tax=Aulographum hederae CBS 113979 TaxID=1176131 RepID=A0A6G1H513_9PEZI|nr:putative aldo-keto reductase [Aulographum hederae CBS 113979]
MDKVKNAVSSLTGAGSKIPTVPLGKNGPQVNRLGLGLMGLSVFYGPKKPDAERLAFLDAAYERGERFWDTADMYGDNEDLLGQWFAKNPDKRKDIFLATKFANKNFPDGSWGIDSSAAYCKQALEKSLKRLGLPYVDLYYCHRLNKDTPVEETMGALKEAQDAGKIKHIGLSECSSESLRRAYAVAPVAVVQIEYSPFSLDIEDPTINLLNTCRELGVAIVCYSPLGRGMLSGTIRSPDDFEEGDFRKMAPRFSAENFPKNLELVDTIAAIAKRKGCSPSQLTLAWMMAQGQDFFPIPGTTSVKRLEENVGSVDVKLTEQEEQEVRRACENAEVKGSRYPEWASATLFVTTVPAKV